MFLQTGEQREGKRRRKDWSFGFPCSQLPRNGPVCLLSQPWVLVKSLFPAGLLGLNPVELNHMRPDSFLQCVLMDFDHIVRDILEYSKLYLTKELGGGASSHASQPLKVSPSLSLLLL